MDFQFYNADLDAKKWNWAIRPARKMLRKLLMPIFEKQEACYAALLNQIEEIQKTHATAILELQNQVQANEKKINEFAARMQTDEYAFAQVRVTAARLDALTVYLLGNGQGQGGLLKSSLARAEQLASPAFQAWKQRMRETRYDRHRKVWEWCFIAQALQERGMLAAGKRGLGFAVGEEPLPALFAACRADVVATDQSPEKAAEQGWTGTKEYAGGLAGLNARRIADDATFKERVKFEYADMNAIGDHLRNFDFLWSSCSMEHLGSLEHGMQFVQRTMDCLKPGGVAVHTTEYNVDSDDSTVTEGGSVIYRRRDILELAMRLIQAGHKISLDLTPGFTEADLFIDREPYKLEPHFKLELFGHVTTSIGLIVQKRG